MPYWSKIVSIIWGFDFAKYMTYVIAVLGLVIGLKTKLIGDDIAFAKSINGGFLFAGALLALTAILGWVLTELILRLRCPPDILIYLTISKFLQAHKDSVLDDEHFRDTFDRKSKEWSAEDIKYPCSRAIVTVGFSFSLTLAALSFVLVAVSVAPILLNLLHSEICGVQERPA